MSTIVPTGGQTAQGTPPVATSGPVVIEAGTAAQAALVGNIVTGTVIGRDARGAVQLRTQNGVILLHTNARLPTGATVTLQVQPVGAQLQAILLQVIGSNGRPLPIGVDPALPHAPAAAPPPASGAQPATVTVAEGATVTAIVIGRARPGTPAAGAAQQAAPNPAPAADPTSRAPLPQPLPESTPPGPAQAPAVPASSSAPPLSAPAGSAIPVAPGGAVPSAPQIPAAPSAAAPGGAPTASQAPAAVPPLAAQAPTAHQVPTAPQVLIGAGVAVPSAPPPSAPAPPAAVPAAAAPRPVDIATSVTIAAAVAAQSSPGGARAPAARGAPAAAIAGNPVGAAVIQSGSAPAASLAYAATQAATTHVQPAPRGGAAAPAIDATHAAAPARAIPSAPLPPGSALEVRVAAEVTPGLPEAGSQAPALRNKLPATIVGRTPTGQGIVDTAAGRLAVPLPPELAAAPLGTRLTLDVVAWRAAVAAPSAPATPGALDAAALQPVLDSVDAIARATRGRVDPHAALPRPGQRLAQQLADMAAALATGDVAAWLGKPAVDALERRGQGELLRRLEHDLYEAARTAPQTPEWRGMILPFVVGDSLRPLRFYVRQRHERVRDKQPGTRFVVECDHDELGALQLDGLVHGKRLDLVLRSHAPLGPAMRGDLSALFGDACGVMGYAGTIEFQAVPAFPAMPRPEPAPHTVGVVA